MSPVICSGLLMEIPGRGMAPATTSLLPSGNSSCPAIRRLSVGLNLARRPSLMRKDRTQFHLGQPWGTSRIGGDKTWLGGHTYLVLLMNQSSSL